MQQNNWQQKDSQFVWHPYTPQTKNLKNIVITRGEGVYLIDQDGNRYLDAIASWWVNTHGHAHPYIAQKISEQLNTLEHVIFAGFTHLPAIKLAERLLQKLPSNQHKIFYSDNGSTAVEVAIKMALQYFGNQGIKKDKLIAFKNAYHGDTFGAMSVSARSVFNAVFQPFLFDVLYIDLPCQDNFAVVLETFENYIKTENVAAFIFEPLVQGAAGMLMYEAIFLDKLLEIAQKYHVLTIADEVMTGFGRTGKMFASDFLTHKPDMVCLSKGLTAGTMPLGVTSCTEDIYQAFLNVDKSKTFFHGHSFTANPLACTAALANLDLFEAPDFEEKINMIASEHKAFAEKIKHRKNILSVRTQGTILAIELKTPQNQSNFLNDILDNTNYLNDVADKIYHFFIQRHILIRPLGNVFYVLPPYVISKPELHSVYQAIEDFLEQ